MPSAIVKSDGNVDVDISIDDGDLNAVYTSELQKFATPAAKETPPPNTSDEKEDYYKGFRSAVVLVRMFCNAALVAIVLNTGGLNRLSVRKEASDEEAKASAMAKFYLTVVLWSVACLSAFKFVGAMWYLIGRVVSINLQRSIYLLTKFIVSTITYSYVFPDDCKFSNRHEGERSVTLI